MVELSGFLQNGKLTATLVEKESDDPSGAEVKTKGTIDAVLAIDQFTMGDLTIAFDNSTELEDMPSITATADWIGLSVEVEGTLTDAANLFAESIELEGGTFADNVENVQIEGVVAEFNSLSSFKISGQLVDASSSEFEPSSLVSTLGDGMRIEVEGPIVNGFLEATEVESRGGDVKVTAAVASMDVSAGLFTVNITAGNPLTVTVNSQTLMDDERSSEPLSLSLLNEGDVVEVNAVANGDGSIVATHVKREDERIKGVGALYCRYDWE